MQNSKDPEGLRVLYYLVQDLKCFVFSLITLHFKVRSDHCQAYMCRVSHTLTLASLAYRSLALVTCACRSSQSLRMLKRERERDRRPT